MNDKTERFACSTNFESIIRSALNSKERNDLRSPDKEMKYYIKIVKAELELEKPASKIGLNHDISHE